MTTVKMLRCSVVAAAMLGWLLPSAASAFELPGIFGGTDQQVPAGFGLPAGVGSALEAKQASDQRPVRMAQASDVVGRLSQLEEEVRRLNGRVEELSFQLLQAQEDMRKYREDSEFRFQQLEGGSAAPAATSGERRGDATPPASSTPTATASAAGDDKIGNLLSDGLDTSSVDGTSPTPAAAPAPSSDTSSTVASIEPSGSRDMYDLAYNHLLAGDYQQAEASFRQYSQTYPNAKDAPDAEYWLGESLYQQKKYADAAEVFLDAQKTHPQNGKAPDMMLKLGMSLAKLNNRDTACVTYKEVTRRYPQMSENVKRKLKTEQKAANC